MLKILAILILSIAALVALVQLRAHARELAAEAEFPPIGDMIDVNGIKVHSVVMGEGPDLVLIHGASGNVRDMAFGIAKVLAEDYRVIMFDRPGLGWTQHTAPQYAGVFPRATDSVSEQAALLRAAAQQLGATRPILVGQSYGAAVAWAWALDAPDSLSGIVSLAGVANPWPGKLSRLHRINGSAWGGALLVPVLTALVPDAYVKITIGSIFTPQSPPEGYEDNVGASLTLRRKSLRGNARQVTSLLPQIIDMSKRYSDIQVPVEIVHGDADTIVPLEVHSRLLPDQIPGANLTIIPGGGHMPHHTHTDIVLDAIHRTAQRANLR